MVHHLLPFLCVNLVRVKFENHGDPAPWHPVYWCYIRLLLIRTTCIIVIVRHMFIYYSFHIDMYIQSTDQTANCNAEGIILEKLITI